MKTLLISTYELGHQPLSLASVAAWLRRAGAEVTCVDTSVMPLTAAMVADSRLIALSVPMHTATRLALTLLPRLRAAAPDAFIVCYGLYAPLNAAMLRAAGADCCLGGEVEELITTIWQRLASGERPPSVDAIALNRLNLIPPDRRDLPPLDRYATLITATDSRIAGYTETTRGCKHLCRHCPIVPVYNGRFRVVPRETVLADIRAQVAAGARHITFGDPDFLNGPGHVLPIARAMHAEFPDLTYDVTIKIEHILRYAHLLPELRATGCIMVVSAIESLDDDILTRFAKRHTSADVARAVALLRANDIALNATFVAFTPWTTRQKYRDLLLGIAELDLIESVAPVQYGLRLLIPAGSHLLSLPEVRALIGPFDLVGLVYPWQHPDPAMDALQRAVLEMAQCSDRCQLSRSDFYQRVLDLCDQVIGPGPRPLTLPPTAPIPRLSEPWYCCAEPTDTQSTARYV
ncbi:CUAEP/CCAEP-tail radical SAM (seleno)protein [Chloroflexus sp.]|uniref:CUAEP/CCAEP-tail radical SAM (seleno)protein n=1 Tax=Chloroflexus sp. TaxID=1904827 RepID=UPI00260232AE|nr:CUAEP/CCAEP-tail radical SAM protein [uncultured Chloroflexus sp.]